MNEQESQRHLSRHLLVGIFVALILFGILVVALDWHAAKRVLHQANWEWVSGALLFTALSYLCLGYGFAVASRIFGINLSWRDLVEVGFISSALNNLLASGGAAGYSLRLVVLKRRGQSTSDILAASLFQSYLNTLALLILFPVGLAHLLASRRLSTGEIIGAGIAVVLAGSALALASAIVFSQPLRSTIFRILTRGMRRITGRDMAASLVGFDMTVSRGMSALRTRPSRLVWLLALVIADWTCSLIALGLCFDALGDRLNAGVLLTGFALGVVAGLVSMIPGGLGIQDSSMAGIYALLGVPLEQAVLAAVLFRVVYYFIPFGVSLGFYWRLIRHVR